MSSIVCVNIETIQAHTNIERGTLYFLVGAVVLLNQSYCITLQEVRKELVANMEDSKKYFFCRTMLIRLSAQN